MSANAEIAERIATAFNEGELERGLEEIHPDVEWHLAFHLPDSGFPDGVVRGREALGRNWAQFVSVWKSMSVSVEEVLHDSGDWVAIQLQFRGRLGDSDFEVNRTLFYACRVRDGKIAAMWPFDTADAALEKIGAGKPG